MRICKHPIILISIATSIALHALGICFFLSHPMIMHRCFYALFGLSNAAPQYLDMQEEDLAKKNSIVDEALERILIFSPHFQPPFDLMKLPLGRAIAPHAEAIALEGLSEAIPLEFKYFGEQKEVIAACPLDIEADMPFSLMPFEQEALSFDIALNVSSTISSSITPPLSEEASIYIIDPLAVSAEDVSAVYEPDVDAPLIAKGLIAGNFCETPVLLKTQEEQAQLDSSLNMQALSEHVPFLAHPPLSKMHAFKVRIDSPLDQDFIDNYLPLEISTTAEWNEDFDMDVCFLPHPEGKGYIFSLSLEPNFDISQYSLKHDVLFVIDRSIRKHRFSLFKRAVVKALASMQQGDTFNIYIIDKKMTRFNAHSLTVSPKTIRAAEEFLEKEEDNAFFAQNDIFSSLEMLLPEIKAAESVHSIILLTDGVSQLSSRKQQQVFKNLVEKTSNNACIYTAAVGRGNDLVMLDFLSSVTGGKMLWSDTNASFARKLSKLILDLKDPIATNLLIQVHPVSSDAHINLMLSYHQLPLLFSHQPYVIFGTIDKPGPFDIVIQAKCRDQWIAIKKTISFMEGRKGDHTLLKKWFAQKTHHPYALFLDNGRPTYLKEAKDILKKSYLEAAFE